jgi:hypothetical protein
MSIEHGTDLTTEFHRIADQPAPPYLVDLGQIVTTGKREKRRRRATRAALSTTTAVVVLCGVAAVAQYPAQSGHVPSAAGPASVASSSTGSAATARAYLLPTNLSDSAANVVETVLRGDGYEDLFTKSMASDTVPAGNVIDIVDARNQSVVGKTVATDASLTLLVSSGPSR